MLRFSNPSRLNLEFMMPALVLSGCIFFNFVLCFANTNLFHISNGIIIVCELALIGLAALWAFKRVDRTHFYWVLLIAVLAVIAVCASALQGVALVKPFRDIFIVPVFAAFGLACTRFRLTPFLLVISFIVVAIACLEGFAPDWFLNVFNFKEYFIAKGALEDADWLTMNTFASGVRPGGRFLLDIPGMHRVSSVFLEPVSLGFYGFVSGLYFVAMRDRMSWFSFAVGLAMAFLLIWFSDARMAFAALFYAILLRPVLAHIDHRFHILVFPAMLLAAYLITVFGLMSTEGEGMGARFHSTMEVISKVDFNVLAGYSRDTLGFTLDSALAYLLQNLGLMGFLLFWLCPFFYARRLSVPARIYLGGTAFFIAFSFLISAAIFTIKTAALLWFIFGYLLAYDFDSEESAENRVSA